MADKIQAVVLRKFRNKYSKTVFHPGDIVELTENRLNEINSAGHGVLVEEIDVGATLTDPPEDAPEDPPVDEEPEDDDEKDEPPQNDKE